MARIISVKAESTRYANAAMVEASGRRGLLDVMKAESFGLSR